MVSMVFQTERLKGGHSRVLDGSWRVGRPLRGHWTPSMPRWDDIASISHEYGLRASLAVAASSLLWAHW